MARSADQMDYVLFLNLDCKADGLLHDLNLFFFPPDIALEGWCRLIGLPAGCRELYCTPDISKE